MSKRLTDLKEATREVLDCRDLGHAWKHVDDIVTAGHDHDVLEYVRIQQCLRCESRRQQTIDKYMNIVRSRMFYADRYLMAKGVKVNRRAVRFEQFDRAMKNRSEK